MSTAMIGGGAFGAMTAIRLAELGERVSLFERLPGLLLGASANANRLHQGFHYPRDEETARQCLRGYRRFRDDFESAILANVTNAYFIASDGSLTSPDAFLAFCRRVGLPHTIIDLGRFRPDVKNVQFGVMTGEAVYDGARLRTLMTERLRQSGVRVRLGAPVTNVARRAGGGFSVSVDHGPATHFDSVVNCTYAEINGLTSHLGHPVDTFLYEYTAAALVTLNSSSPISITILDGPFMTLLPFGRDGEHLLYHVRHSVIASACQRLLDPSWLRPDASPFATMNRDRWFQTLLASCCEFVPALQGARLTRILQGPRMVIADQDGADARPSVVRAHEPGYVSVLSGKIDHCVWAADDVARRLGFAA